MDADLHALARLPEDWERALSTRGEPPFRARQIFRWIHARGVTDAERMTDLGRDLRGWLGAIEQPARIAEMRRSGDGTRKLVLELSGGARVECVLIPMTRSEDADAAAAADEEPDADDGETSDPAPARVTLCISTQFGCAMGCVFCASGRAGLLRGLGAHEIVSQVLLARGELEPGERLRNLVFMGMGEPLHHYDETARALRLLMHPLGAALSPRRITVSTVGLIPGIQRLGRDFGGKLGLAVSLHAPDDATRDRIVPMNRRYPIHELMAALRDYPLPRRRRITIEYTLIAGENDRVDQAYALARLLKGLRVKVNLIPMNDVAGAGFRAPPPERVAAFREALAGAGLSCFVRTRRGDDVAAACGQLALASDLVRQRSG